MDIVVTPYTLQDVFNNVKSYLSLKNNEWTGRVVTVLKSALVYLEDPRVAISATCIVNFAILEIAIRIGRLVSCCCSGKTQTERQIKSAIEVTLAAGLTLIGNIAWVKATGIALHPCLVATLIGLSFIIKYNLENYLEPQPISADIIG